MHETSRPKLSKNSQLYPSSNTFDPIARKDHTTIRADLLRFLKPRLRASFFSKTFDFFWTHFIETVTSKLFFPNNLSLLSVVKFQKSERKHRNDSKKVHFRGGSVAKSTGFLQLSLSPASLWFAATSPQSRQHSLASHWRAARYKIHWAKF